MTRLVGQHRATGRVTDRCARSSAATPAPLLAEVDAALGDMSGPATRAVMRREFEAASVALSAWRACPTAMLVQLAPVSHLPTQTHHVHQDPADAGRHWRAPQAPARRAARLPTRRHRSPGRLDGVKGVYRGRRRGHTVRAHRLRPGHLRTLSPPRARSEPPGVSLSNPGIPHRQWLRVHQPTGRGAAQQAAYRRVTKSRARKSNDNALVEGKNAAVVRKHLGYDHIPQRFSARVNAFTHDVLSPFLNHHRPCLFPTEQRDHKGKIKKRYRDQDIATPYEKQIPNAATFLKPGHLPTTLPSPMPKATSTPPAQSMPPAAVPNHRLPVGTRRRVTPPLAHSKAFPTTPSRLQHRAPTRAIASTLASTVHPLTCLPIPPRCTLSFYIQPLGPQPDSPPLHALRSGSRIGKRC